MTPRSLAAMTLSVDKSWLSIPQLGPKPLPLQQVETSACTQACPAGIHVKSYVSLIAEERFAEALQVVRAHCPLPGVCGRVCTHPCEEACQRGSVDEPVAIRALKRFVSDRELEFETSSDVLPVHGAKVAIIGSGPAGLTAAWDLRRAGHPVTIFEGESEPGGMLRHGIADYRLPPDILKHEIDYILRTGIELKTGVRLGRDLDLETILRDGYGAVVLATGAQIGRRLGLDGEQGVSGVEDALAFLRRVNAGSREKLEGRVLVVGGGSTAIEAARAALRLGARAVKILYRRTQEQMPCSQEEVLAAQSEGIEIDYLVAPSRLVLSGDQLVGLECVRSKLGAPDASGRPRPEPIANSEFVVTGQHVLAAIGQDIDLSFLPTRGRSSLADGRNLHVDDATGATRLSGVFAAGDLVTGPSTVIEAIATGHRAAASARGHLGGKSPRVPKWQQRFEFDPTYELPNPEPPRATRIHPHENPIDPEAKFAEVEEAFSFRDAVAEARRCLRCGPCDECRICAPSCQRRHVALRTTDAGEPRETVVRAPVDLALSLEGDAPAAGTLYTGEGENAKHREIEAMPFRANVLPAECRGCESCVAVCSFDAIRVAATGRESKAARIDPSRCRGCNLCTAVCPTAAARATVFSVTDWDGGSTSWRHGTAPDGRTAVLVCEHKAAEVAPKLSGLSRGFELVRLRCLGQLEEGVLLDAFLRGAERVFVGGCEDGQCRFVHGSGQAAEVVERARGFLRSMGHDAGALHFVRTGELEAVAMGEARS